MIGERLKEERDRLGMTQPQFAEAAGAAKRTLIEWEKGATAPNAVQLSALGAIGVDVLYVVTGERDLRQVESQDQFAARMQAINATARLVDALPLPEREREGVKLCLMGDPVVDAKVLADALQISWRAQSAQSALTSPQEQIRYSQGTVVPLPTNESASLTQGEVLAIVLDALHAAGRTLPAAKVFAVVDAIMAWQRAGIGVTDSAVQEQLRQVK